MFDCNKIKIVIWDLDDTFWGGTLSEGEIIPIKRNVELVKILTDAGIISSICSKNNKTDVDAQLTRMGLENYFVFQSISWEPKGQRVHKQIEKLNLREENVLFIDDNHSNIEEVKYYNPGIMVAGPEDIDILYNFAVSLPLKDTQHKRLQQYKILEQKLEEKGSSSSNEEFLLKSNIKVELNYDCINQIKRIHELVLRTNQLNFTKNRMPEEELIDLCNDPSIKSGYVSVSDRFGDYGIVGFYALENNRLIHFLFSCRTIGMGIEQYVYAKLNYPEITVVGSVTGELTKQPAPDWINRDAAAEKEEKLSIDLNKRPRILFKGPCDLENLFSYIEANKSIECEFTYVNEKTGVVIEQVSHTSHIVQSITLKEEQKRRVINELPFSDENMYSDLLFRKPFNIVFISVLTDANLGVYKRKETGELVAFAEAYYPLTEKSNWGLYASGKLYNANCKLTAEFLEEFSEKYEFCGKLSVAQIIENIKFIRQHVNKETAIVIMLGSEIYYEKNTFPAYRDRHVLHKQINDAVKDFAAQNKNVFFIDTNKYIHDQNCFHYHFNHFSSAVYYEMAKDIVNLINDSLHTKVASASVTAAVKGMLKNKIKKILLSAK